MLIERNIPIERTDKGENHLCLSLVHTHDKGYYLYCYPVIVVKRRRVSSGAPVYLSNKISDKGMKVFVKMTSKRTPETDRTAIEIARNKSEWLIAMVCNRYKLRRV